MSSFGATGEGVSKSQCPHIFVRTRVLTSWTQCLGCRQVCWVGNAMRRCNLCGVHYHEVCFEKARADPAAPAAETAALRSRPATPSTTGEGGGEGGQTSSSTPAAPAPEPWQHVHELYSSRTSGGLSCDGCGKPVPPVICESLTCVDCDAVFHKACGEGLPAEAAVLLRPDELEARMAVAHNASVQEQALGDTLALLAKFNARNKNWFLTAANPLAMSRLRQQQSALYKEACAALPDANLDGFELAALRAALRFATAAYGQAYEQGHMSSAFGNLMMRLANRSVMAPKVENNNVAVTQILHMPRSALLHARWGRTVFEPSYCLVLDPDRHWLVLAFRGSLSDADFLSDACGHLAAFCGGQAHQGMCTMIDRVLADEDLLARMTEVLTQRANFKLVVVGHSLGAGLALLFTIRVLHEKTFGDGGISEPAPESDEDRRRRGLRRPTAPDCVECSWLHCYAFAPPPVVTMPLADRFDRVITSVVVAKDVVARLQMTSVDRLGAQLAQCSGASIAADANSQANFADGVEECFIAGSVLFSTKPNHLNTRVVWVDRAHLLLRDIFISSYMVSNHIMDQYALALAAYAAAAHNLHNHLHHHSSGQRRQSSGETGAAAAEGEERTVTVKDAASDDRSDATDSEGFVYVKPT